MCRHDLQLLVNKGISINDFQEIIKTVAQQCENDVSVPNFANPLWEMDSNISKRVFSKMELFISTGISQK